MDCRAKSRASQTAVSSQVEKERAMTEEEKKAIEAEFNRIRKELDSEEGQRKAQVRLMEEIKRHAKAHADFLARSKERSFTRVVR